MSSGASQPRIWWVNQGDTFSDLRDGGYIWSRYTDVAGNSQWHWDTLNEVRKGDILVHYSTGAIRALGRATKEAYDDFATDVQAPGRTVDVEYFVLKPTIALKPIAERIRAVQPHQGPLTINATAHQCYLARFNIQGLRVLRGASSAPWPDWAEAALEGRQSHASS